MSNPNYEISYKLNIFESINLVNPSFIFYSLKINEGMQTVVERMTHLLNDLNRRFLVSTLEEAAEEDKP